MEKIEQSVARRQDYLLNAYGEKLKKKTKNQNKLIKEVFRFDPSPTKKYSEWIISNYVKGKIKSITDFQKFGEYIRAYDSLRQKGYFVKNSDSPYIDLGGVEPDKLADWIDSLDIEGFSSKAQQDRALENRLIESGDACILHDDDTCKITQINSFEASCYFGRNTRWCTASVNFKDNYLYYKKKGHLYIVLNKKNNKRWQFHFDYRNVSMELCDEKDKNICIGAYSYLPDIVSVLDEETLLFAISYFREKFKTKQYFHDFFYWYDKQYTEVPQSWPLDLKIYLSEKGYINNWTGEDILDLVRTPKNRHLIKTGKFEKSFVKATLIDSPLTYLFFDHFPEEVQKEIIQYARKKTDWRSHIARHALSIGEMWKIKSILAHVSAESLEKVRKPKKEFLAESLKVDPTIAVHLKTKGWLTKELRNVAIVSFIEMTSLPIKAKKNAA